MNPITKLKKDLDKSKLEYETLIKDYAKLEEENQKTEALLAIVKDERDAEQKDAVEFENAFEDALDKVESFCLECSERDSRFCTIDCSIYKLRLQAEERT